MQKSRGLAWCICYQEKFENQDVAFWHDYGKGGGRRGEDKKDKICKKMLTIFSFLYNMGGCIIKLQLSEFLVHENLDIIIRMKLVTSLKLANIDIEIITVWEKQIKHVTIMISIFDMGLIKCGLY